MDARQIRQLMGSHQETVDEVTDLAVTMKGVISPALLQFLKIEVIQTQELLKRSGSLDQNETTNRN